MRVIFVFFRFRLVLCSCLVGVPFFLCACVFLQGMSIMFVDTGRIVGFGLLCTYWCVFRCVFWHLYLVHVVEHWEEGKKSVLSFNLCKIHASKKYKNVYTSI